MDQEELIEIIEKAAHENVQKLDLSNLGIIRLPRQIGRLVNVMWLYLHNNELATLPEEIGKLVNLKTLALDGNRLERLPRSIGSLKHLSRLDIGHEKTGNPLIDLPAEMRNLTRLRHLDVSNCPGLNLPPEIVAKESSPQEILDYYFRSRTEPAQPLNEAKVLVVGEAEVGKTSLIKRLLGLEFDPNEDQTHGIVTHHWNLPQANRTVRLNVWDFGGQEIMHATHQFFLTKRSLYLLVLDSRQNERQSRIEYWLKLIHSFGEDSPVIVVCNKCDQQQMELDWSGLRAKYPQIKAFIRRVSCYRNKETSEDRSEGLDEVHAAIAEQIAGLEHVDTLFPETWFNIKQRLEDLSESYMLYTDYTTLCEENDITEDKEQRQLIEFLHDLGIVLHFHDHPILRDLNILNPLWVTTAVYRILTCTELANAHGVLTFDELGTLLEKVAERRFKYPPERQLFVIEMMRRFELLFDFEGQVNQKFLIAGLLPLEQPEDVDTGWDDSLGFRYQYEVLPNSVISRFIVRMHQRIHDETYWRKGVVLESLDGDAHARVRADFEDARIDIRIRGEAKGRRRFLQSIRDQFDAIHATIPRLETEEQVPLPEHPEVLVDYERLLLFEKKGIAIDHVKVGDDLVEVNVNELLEGIRHPAGLDVFISYAHADGEWLQRFNIMLKPLVRDGRITTWSDEDISASHLWREEIDRSLKMARSGLLLVSPAFLASDFIMKHEVPYLLRAHEEGRTRIIFAVLSECFWNETPLKDIQAAHDPGKPLDGLPDADCSAVVKSICQKLMKKT
ncbi:MAG: GTP-binding protein [Phycisphaerales bacterium]|nr:MAG: GTP-binding protein [Phycisphaerales bacterium]